MIVVWLPSPYILIKRSCLTSILTEFNYGKSWYLKEYVRCQVTDCQCCKSYKKQRPKKNISPTRVILFRVALSRLWKKMYCHTNLPCRNQRHFMKSTGASTSLETTYGKTALRKHPKYNYPTVAALVHSSNHTVYFFSIFQIPRNIALDQIRLLFCLP